MFFAVTDVASLSTKSTKGTKNISRRLLADGVIAGSPIAENAHPCVAGRAYSELYAAIKEHASINLSNHHEAQEGHEDFNPSCPSCASWFKNKRCSTSCMSPMDGVNADMAGANICPCRYDDSEIH